MAIATPDEPVTERIVVAVDASAASRLALELAADLAAALGTRLTGLYVEEEGLLHAAGLPFVRSIGAQSGRPTPFTPDELERQWRALAARARDTLEQIAHARRLAWSFEVTRGPAGDVLRAAARGARLMGLGFGERPSAVMAQAALRLIGTPLLLAPSRHPAGGRWVAVVDTAEDAQAVLALAGSLAPLADPPVLLMTRSMQAACQDARQLLAPSLACVHLPEPGDLQAVIAALRSCAARGVIVTARSPLGQSPLLDRLLAGDNWAVLRVSSAAPEPTET